MAWSTRQLAELADTTVNTIRHYHKIGLLDLPERAANGYKRYAVSHLVRLLQIKRLSDLGVPLSQVGAMGNAEEDLDEIRAINADIEATMTRLARIRDELAVVLEHRAPADVPSGFAHVSQSLSTTQRSMLMVYSTIFNDSALKEFRDVLTAPDVLDKEFENLPTEADDDTIDALARRMAPETRRVRDAHPALADPTAQSPRGEESAKAAMAQALVELYNPAQLRLLQRLDQIVMESYRDDFDN